VVLCSLSMPRVPKSYCSPAAKLICPVKACMKNCRTHSGLTQHLHAKHKEYQAGNSSPAAVNDLDNSGLLSESSTSINDSASDHLGAWDSFGSEHDGRIDFENPLSPVQESAVSDSDSSSTSSTEYHPLINGQ
jgi:hypothetical protein